LSNCSGSHQGTKSQRIDLPAIGFALGEFPNSGTRKQAGMSFTPLSEKEERIARKTVD